MPPMVGLGGQKSGNGKTAAVDAALAKLHGGRPATWHSRRCGRDAVNRLAAAIIDTWRHSGDQEELALWVRPIEAALEGIGRASGESPRFKAALADAVEDEAEARYYENPCETTARFLLRKRAGDRRASLEHDQEIAANYGIML
jgi:hypothetical protein